MTWLWVFLGVLASTPLIVRWQNSQLKGYLDWTWYRRWEMRRKQRNLSMWFYKRYPRLMHFRHRVMMPWYRFRNQDWVWKVRLKFDHWWFVYSGWWLPKCPEHGSAIRGGMGCIPCVMQEGLRRVRLEELTGRD